MLTSKDLEFLRDLSVFAGLREDVVARIGEHARRIDLQPRDVLFREGEPAKEMVVVVEGELDVLKRADSGEAALIATLGPGDVAGEMALIDIQPRSAELRAHARAVVVSISQIDLASVYRDDVSSYTLLVLNIAREISLRLRRLDRALANIMAEIETVTAHTFPGRGLVARSGIPTHEVSESAAATEPVVPANAAPDAGIDAGIDGAIDAGIDSGIDGATDP